METLQNQPTDPPTNTPDIPAQVQAEVVQPEIIQMPKVQCKVFPSSEEKYTVVSYRIGEPPEVFSIDNKKKLKKKIMKLSRITDQQYLFVIKGECMKLFKSATGLTLRLADEAIRIPMWSESDTRISIDDGWIGD
jgi:hypothetical protein